MNENVMNNNGGLACPKCGSHDIAPVSKVRGKTKGFGLGKAAVGAAVTLSPVGLAAGAIGMGKGKTSSEIVWVCKNCGNEFDAKKAKKTAKTKENNAQLMTFIKTHPKASLIIAAVIIVFLIVSNISDGDKKTSDTTTVNSEITQNGLTKLQISEFNAKKPKMEVVYTVTSTRIDHAKDFLVLIPSVIPSSELKNEIINIVNYLSIENVKFSAKIFDNKDTLENYYQYDILFKQQTAPEIRERAKDEEKHIIAIYDSGIPDMEDEIVIYPAASNDTDTVAEYREWITYNARQNK